MTNIANKIYNHATVLAGNLRAKGVPDVTANMGLADLIDKVLDIDQASNGLYLFSDKKIAQSGNTINLSSMILEDKQIKPGETITFYYTFIDKKMKVNEEIQIPSQFQNYDWDITIEKTNTNDQILLLKQNSSESILLGNSTLTLSSNQVLSVNNPCYKIRGNTIYFDDNSVEISEGLNKTIVSNFSATSPHVSITALIPVVVQNNGLATYSMTCNGSGKKSFYTTYGNFVSEIYSILDAIYYDTGISGTASDIWYNQQNAVNTRGDTYSEITENGGTAILRLKSTNSIDKTNICVEFDVWQDGATSNNFMSFANTTMSTYTGTYNLGNLNLQTETWNHIKLEIDNNGVITPNGLTSAQKTLSVNTDKMLFAFLTNGDITKIRFKDWRVYPI